MVTIVTLRRSTLLKQIYSLFVRFSKLLCLIPRFLMLFGRQVTVTSTVKPYCNFKTERP